MKKEQNGILILRVKSQVQNCLSLRGVERGDFLSWKWTLEEQKLSGEDGVPFGVPRAFQFIKFTWSPYLTCSLLVRGESCTPSRYHDSHL